MRDIHSKKPEECQYSFTQHKTCEFFPCHKTEHPEDFNCLFCYCPLYTLGSKCGGNFRYLSGAPRAGQLQLHHEEISGADGAGQKESVKIRKTGGTPPVFLIFR